MISVRKEKLGRWESISRGFMHSSSWLKLPTFQALGLAPGWREEMKVDLRSLTAPRYGRTWESHLWQHLTDGSGVGGNAEREVLVRATIFTECWKAFQAPGDISKGKGMSRAILLKKCIVLGGKVMEHVGDEGEPRKIGWKQMVNEGSCMPCHFWTLFWYLQGAVVEF